MNATRRLLAFAFVAGAILSADDVKADFAFGEPVNLKAVIPVLDPAHDGIDCLSYDGLEIYIGSDRPGGQGSGDIWVIRRASLDDDWGPLENLGPAVNGPTSDGMSSISADGLTLYFFSYDRPGGYGHYDIYMTTRPTKNDPWGPATNLGPKINGSAGDGEPWISPDGLELVVHSWRPGGYGRGDIYVARRATPNDPWGEALNLGPVVNTADDVQYPSLSPDGLLLLFCDGPFYVPPTGGYGGSDMWMARRASLSAPWQAPARLSRKVNGAGGDYTPRISPDGRTLYFWSDRGGLQNYQAPIIPIIDFNGDGKVDGKEVLALVEHWGEDYPLGDIGPFAWGDGMVDVNDLKVLAEYMGKDVEDPTLVAHWAFDETAGTVAKDSADGHEATLMGNPAWQPAGGKVGGALTFDGLNDFGFATVALNPPGQAFSVLAWVKGGAPGEVVIAEQNGKNWLYANAAGGCLATALNSAGRTAAVLSSPVAITDGQWHRVAVVWDGTDRVLYVDDQEVARDALSALDLSSVRLVLGGGSNLAPVTFWSGLIDEVRIYSRVVKP
jgi:hypothetical protein